MTRSVSPPPRHAVIIPVELSGTAAKAEPAATATATTTAALKATTLFDAIRLLVMASLRRFGEARPYNASERPAVPEDGRIRCYARRPSDANRGLGPSSPADSGFTASTSGCGTYPRPLTTPTRPWRPARTGGTDEPIAAHVRADGRAAVVVARDGRCPVP